MKKKKNSAKLQCSRFLKKWIKQIWFVISGGVRKKTFSNFRNLFILSIYVIEFNIYL